MLEAMIWHIKWESVWDKRSEVDRTPPYITRLEAPKQGLASIYWVSRFQIPFEIQNICKPTSSLPFEIRTV